MVRLPYVNPVTGPIHVDGATPEHVLACRIEGMELHPPGFTALVPGFGPFVDWIRHRDFGGQPTRHLTCDRCGAELGPQDVVAERGPGAAPVAA